MDALEKTAGNRLSGSRRLIVKIGSALLVEDATIFLFIFVCLFFVFI